MNRSLPWRSPLTITLLTVSLIFLALGLRTFLLPVPAAAFFGVPTEAPDALAFVQAYGARNIAISLVALALLVLDVRAGLVVLLAAAALVAALDASVMFGRAGLPGAAKHIVYVAVLSSLAATTGLLSGPARNNPR